MVSADLDSVLMLENAIFPTPWSRDSFEAELEKTYSVALTAEREGRVIGYGIAWLIADEIHIANVAVHPEFRGTGIGRAIVERLLASGDGSCGAFLEVRVHNDPAIRLYKKLGFREIGVRKQYYQAEQEDALLMRKDFR
ncbi:ribosomal protein S18-alanine N-acetyltransferase [bacterium]|nr:ribosomal protein S18-alanine N-acetyltransferase [bacterium]